MRIRQVKPDFWKDSKIAELSDTTRLVYIGLWMEADDTGWLRLDVVEIASDLYPLSPRKAREKRVEEAIADLVRTRRLERQDDCNHALIRTLPLHQRLASPEKQVRTISREHAKCAQPADTRGDPREPAETRTSPTRNGTVREGQERNGGVQGGSPSGSGLEYVFMDGKMQRVGAGTPDA